MFPDLAGATLQFLYSGPHIAFGVIVFAALVASTLYGKRADRRRPGRSGARRSGVERRQQISGPLSDAREVSAFLAEERTP